MAGGGGKTSRGTSEMWLNYESYRQIIDEADLFSKPAPTQGWDFTKPYEFLAAACVECGLDEENVKEGIAKALARNSMLYSRSKI